MAQEVQAGTVLMQESPEMVDFLGLNSEPFLGPGRLGNWRLVSGLDGFGFDRKVRASGWNLFFMAAEVKATVLGGLSTGNVRKAVKRILGKSGEREFNCLEVTGIAAKHFLGVPYTTVSAHSRHIQKDWQLDDLKRRQAGQRDAAWAKG
jgi:hypothetical protein